ncbi:MAG: dTMP kinase [Candidatus Bipolaricaulota bacterium]
MFIVLEGPDASGKSTQLELLAHALAERGISPVTTREPGDTDTGAALRRLLLSPCSKLRPLTELLLMVADRHEHVEEVIRPALAQGRWVICSRYALSSVVYQGIARGLGAELAHELNRHATGGLESDHTFLLDLPPEIAYERTGRRDRFEEEGLAFFAKVREAYLTLLETQPGAHVIDATLPPEQVCQNILARLPLP